MDSTLQIGFLFSALIHVAVLTFAGGLVVEGTGSGANTMSSSVEVELVSDALSAPEKHLDLRSDAPLRQFKSVPARIAVKSTPTAPMLNARSSQAASGADARVDNTASEPDGVGMKGGGMVLAHPDDHGNIPPIYPESARRAQQQGVVVLLVDISTNGRPLAVAVEKSSGVHSLDTSAIKAVTEWKFRPETVAGIPRPSSIRVPVRFRLENP